jgi:TPR repeat protein
MAMVYWGDDVYNGRYHQRPNKEQAYRWWRVAADRHHPEAQYYMAFGYRSGECGATDPLLAMMYAKESEEGGFPRAHRLQGFLYRRGEFVEKDLDKAVACYRKAVDMGDYLSLNYIGDVEWFRDNKDTAVSFYRQAVEHADAGRIKSGAPYYNLGFAHRKGEGAEKDSRTACKMYLKGAARNHPNCQKWAALTIQQDLEDPEEKFALLEEASRYNCRRAEFYLGKLLEAKLEDKSAGSAEALKWYELGVDKGDVDCMRYAMEYYSAVANPAAFRDREKALAVMRLFFSMWDADQQEVEEKSGFTFSIAYYYQLYAFELASTPKTGKADRELSLFYARKCLAEKNGSDFWGNFVALGWQYLVPEAKTTLVEKDPAAGKGVVLLLLEYMDAYLNSNAENQKKKFRLQGLSQCLDQLEKQYQDTKSVLAKPMSGKEAAAEARRFRDLATEVRERAKQL